MASDTIKALTVPYRAGERIVTAGEPGACVFVVQSGTVRLSRPAQPGTAAVEIATLEKGDVFGEVALIEGRPYASDAEAASDCEVLEFGPATFDKMVRSHPEVAVRLLRQLAARMDRTEERLAALAPSEARPRESAPFAQLVQEDGAIAFQLSGTELLIGRYDPVTEIQPEIDLGPLDTKRSVSRRHARLVAKDGSWFLAEEPGALNGTSVNGVRLSSGKGAPLSEGDVISFGMVRFVFHGSGEA